MKLYEVEFINIYGKEVKMRLTLSDDVAALNLHPKKLITETNSVVKRARPKTKKPRR